MKKILAFLLSLLLLAGCTAFAEEGQTVPEGEYVPVKGNYSVTFALPEGYISAEDFTDPDTCVVLLCDPADPQKPVLYVRVLRDGLRNRSSIGDMTRYETDAWRDALTVQYAKDYDGVCAELMTAGSGGQALVVTGERDGAYLTEVFCFAGGYEILAHVTCEDWTGKETLPSLDQMKLTLEILTGAVITPREE